MSKTVSVLTLDHARTIIAAAFSKAAELDLLPLAVVVLDAGGHIKAIERQDGASNARPEVAMGKASGAISMGIGSRALFNRAEQQAYFVGAVNGLLGGKMVPVPGGVLVKDSDGNIMGAVGISGDNSDNDEAAAVAGIEATGLTPVTG